MIVRTEEFVAARDAARNFSTLVERLKSGELDKAVILHRNRATVVMMTVERYEELSSGG